MTWLPKTHWTLSGALLLLLVLPRCQSAEAPLPPPSEALPAVEEAPRQESPPVGEAPPPAPTPAPTPEPEARAELCSSGGWCWKHPETPTDPYWDTWALDDTHAIAVGSPNRVLHWSHGDWKFLPSDTGHLLYSVWGSSPTDAWAVGEGGTIVHWDGTRWTRVREGGATLHTVFGTSAREVWAGGEEGTLLHWDGTRWSQVPSGTSVAIRRLWGSGAGDLWVATFNPESQGGALRRWNGQTWSTSLEAAELFISSIWGFGPDDVWITGGRGLLAHWTGAQWQVAPGSRVDQYDRFSSVRGRDPSDLWVMGTGLWHFEGQRLSTHLYNPLEVGAFSAVAMGSKGPLLAVGQEGTLAQYEKDGTWKILTTQRPRSQRPFVDVWAPDARQPWITSEGQVSRWNGASWSLVDEGLPVGAYLSVLSGTSASDVWAAGGGGGERLSLAHFDGTRWSHTRHPLREAPTRIWALDEKEVWVSALGGSILRWTGGDWQTVLTLPGSAYGVHGSSADNVWAVGSGGALWQWNGRQWVDHTLTRPSPTFTSVWVSGPDEVWATASGGDIWRWDGHEVHRVETGVRANLHALYGRAADDVWAVGDAGNIVHWDGKTWTRVPSGTMQWLKGVGGAGGSVFAVGTMQTVLEQREAPGVAR